MIRIEFFDKDFNLAGTIHGHELDQHGRIPTAHPVAQWLIDHIGARVNARSWHGQSVTRGSLSGWFTLDNTMTLAVSWTTPDIELYADYKPRYALGATV